MNERAAVGAAVREIGNLKIDLARHSVQVDGNPVSLTPSELKLLVYLAERPEQVTRARRSWSISGRRHTWAMAARATCTSTTCGTRSRQTLDIRIES